MTVSAEAVVPIAAPAVGRAGVVLGASSEALAGRMVGAGARVLGRPVVEADPGELLRAVLGSALRLLPGPERERAPVVLAAAEPCVRAATRYALRWADTSRRLRPSNSVALETTELVRGLGPDLGWRGPLFLLAAPGAAGQQALLAAGAMARGGRRPVVAELVTAAGQDAWPPEAENGVPEPEWLAVATVWPRPSDAVTVPQRTTSQPALSGPACPPGSPDGDGLGQALPGVLLALAGAHSPPRRPSAPRTAEDRGHAAERARPTPEETR